MYIVDFLKDDREWEEYILSKSSATNYHQLKWRTIVSQTFGHKPIYLIAKENGVVKGVLPLFCMKSMIFGSFITSMPFFNYGGLCVDTIDAAKVLLEKAISVAKDEKVKHIELRHSEDINIGLQVKKNKVTMILELQSDPNVFWERFKPKVRNHIRNAEKNGLVLQIGGHAQLDNFYAVFARNMRDLGTPVYSKVFFSNILKEYPEETKIFSVLLKNKVVASGFTIQFRDTLEIPWASSIREYNKLSTNIYLYWEIIKYACEKGLKYFDFGRCSLDSGTFNFKKQWGTQPKQLYWHYWLKKGDTPPELNPANPKYELFIKIWTRMPVFLANMIGPKIIKFIP